jgi:hypothetical protein
MHHMKMKPSYHAVYSGLQGKRQMGKMPVSPTGGTPLKFRATLALLTAVLTLSGACSMNDDGNAQGSGEMAAFTGPSVMAAAARAFGLPAGAGAPYDVEFRDPDGPMPAALSYSFNVIAKPEAVLDYFRTACRAHGLSSPPPAFELTLQPGLLCSGRFDKGEGILMEVVPKCAGDRCSVYVEITG